MIIVIGAIKGGVGKTTIAVNLTVLRSQTDSKVLLVDADEQKSASTWALQRELSGVKTPWVTIQLSGGSVRTEINKMSKDYDDIIVDAGGRDTRSLRASLAIADIFLVPFLPRSLDIWTLPDLKHIIQEMSEVNQKLKSYALINRADYCGTDNADTLEIIKDCQYISCLPTCIGQRKSFANAASDGLGVIEMKYKDQKAIDEIRSLYHYVFKLIAI